MYYLCVLKETGASCMSTAFHFDLESFLLLYQQLPSYTRVVLQIFICKLVILKSDVFFHDKKVV